MLIKEYSFSKGTLDSLKHDRNISTATLNDICRLLDCRVEDVLVYVPERENSFRPCAAEAHTQLKP